MRSFILSLFFSLFFFNGFSQSLEEKQNMFKYWNYRDVLTRHLLNVPEFSPEYYAGLGNTDVVNERFLRSKSLPMQFYQFYDWCRNEYDHESDWLSRNTDPDCPNEYMVKASDVTSHLGWYIAVLATEWKLLNDKGLPTQRTEEELFWAIKAVERLDKYAEAYMKNGANNFDAGDLLIHKNFGNKQFNGFLMRDDCFAWRNPNFSPSVDRLQDHRTGQEIKILDSDYNDGWRNGGAKTNYMSQDQIIHLFMGFLLVKRLVPDWVKPYGQSLPNLVKIQTRKIMDYLEGKNYFIHKPYTEENVDRGASFDVYREPIAKIGQEIVDLPYAENERLRQIVQPHLAAFALVFWSSQSFLLNSFDEDKQYQLMALAAMTNGWYLYYLPPLSPVEVVGRIFSKIFKTRIRLDPFNVNTTKMGLAILGSSESNRKYIYSYLNQLLYPEPFSLVDHIRPLMSDALNEASCELPSYKFRTERSMVDKLEPSDPNYNTGHLRTAPSGWRGPWRWVRTIPGINGEEGMNGEFNGLDYMLAYNLKLLVENNNNTPSYYENQWNYDLVNTSFPTQNGEGSTQNPKKVIGINKVYIDNVNFNNDSQVEVFSGNEIKLNGRIHSEGDLSVHLKITDELADVCQTIYPNLLLVSPPDRHLNDSTALALMQAMYPDSVMRIPEIVEFIRDSILCLTQVELDSLYSGNASDRIRAKVDSCIRSYDSLYIDHNIPNRKDLEAFIQPTRPIEIELYPNPFRTGFDIRFTLPEKEKVTITVLNGLGVPVLQVVQDQNYPAGTHELSVDGSTLTAGVYCCKVGIGNKTIQTFNLIKTQ